MSRKPNTEARRAEIIRALQSVMATHGYEKATIQAIAKEAGLAPGLLHYHFKSKQEILVSLVTSLADYGQRRFEQIAGKAESPMDLLNAYLEARVGLGDGAAAEIVAAWVMIGAEAVRQAEVREVYQRAIATELELLSELLANCLRERQRVTTGSRDLAAALLAMMEGAYQLASATSGIMPVGYAAQSALRHAMLSIDAAPLATAS
ncbi:TetR/AcrR family transcriptional regulator [Chitinimonas taiwanensis]|uniref:Transcriptional regulator, TetR family n=1 Tax=Chitinimonas taiwanensis DSM 18899 TaxID=1121279 RepID=A0A1K2H4Z4_9NEIS|nr:TetR family transcriptional regulator [Chitinimonas taiwanensis]SFZ71098.1 transcriptional regulator, TetR family [Chitinimonas taiwanensis DSM 18899]